MKRTILALLVVATLIMGVFAFSVFGEESDTTTVTFAPYEDADGVRQYCACGNKFVTDANGTIAYVNGENGCKNHKDENGNVIDGCDGTLIKWRPCNFGLWNDPSNAGTVSAYKVAEDGTVSGMAYYLTKNVASGSQQFGYDAGDYYLDLNGYSFTRKDKRVITPQEGIHLYITDTSPEKDGYIACVDTNSTAVTGQGATIWFRYDNCSVTLFDGIIDGSQEASSFGSGGAVFYNGHANGKVSQFGGTIKSGTATKGNGGFVMNAGTYNLYDGQLIGGTGINGGALYVGSTATANIYGGTITGGTASSAGGNIYALGTVNITGGTISHGVVTNGGGGNLLVGEGAVVTISGGTFSYGNSTAQGGGIRTEDGSTLTINGGTFEYGGVNAASGEITTTQGGNLAALGGTVTINGGTFDGGKSTQYGGNIRAAVPVTLGQNVVLKNGYSKYGGNISNNSGGNITVNGATIQDGTASDEGGNVYNYSGKTFTMNSGLIENGKASNGGNVLNGGTFNMLGGQIKNGTASGRGGNVQSFRGNGTGFTMEEGALVSGGKASYGGNFYVAGVTDDERFGMLTVNGGTIENGEATGTQGGNISVGAQGKVIINDGIITNGTAKTTGGNIHVGSKQAVIQLNGGTVSGGTAANGGNLYAISSVPAESMTVGAVTIQDGTATEAGGNCYILNTCTFTGTTLTGGKAVSGGSIYNAGTLSVSGGSMTGGQGERGGNIYNNGTLTLSGVTVDDGVATGGITVAEDGTVSGGDKTYGGGNIYLEAGELNIQEGTTISDGTTWFACGGNIYADAGTINMTGGTISGGDAKTNNKNTSNDQKHGGNVALIGAATFNISGGTVTGGNAHEGGNFRVSNTATLNISGEALITAGQAGSGGNINNYGVTNMSGGTISGGTATSNGGNVQCFRSTTDRLSVFTVTGGTITGGTAVRGGNVYVAGYKAKTGYFVLESGTVTGGTADYGPDLLINNLGNATVKGGTVNDVFVSSHATDVGATLILAGDPVIANLVIDNDNNFTVNASDLACTTPVPVTVTKSGVAANASTDKSACFTCKEEYTVTYDAAAQTLYVGYPIVQDVYVSATGDDLAAGSEADPVQTFARALNIVADGGTIHLVGVVEVSDWTAHGKSITVTGDEMNVTKGNPFYIRDSVHFKTLTIRFSTVTADTNDTAGKHRVYALGNKVVIDRDVTVKYGADGSGVTGQYVYLFGGGNDANVVSSTDLTVLSGTWGRIFGGSNGSDISGDVHLTVGGNVNQGVDYVSHDYSSHYLIHGGSSAGNIGGTVYMNVTGGTHTSTHGASIGASGKTYTIGGIEMHVTGGEGMAIYGGGRGGLNKVTGEANIYIEGGYYEQVFGGGLNAFEGTLNLYVTGGEISRRLYGGCYNEWLLTYKTSNQVNGIVNLYIGSGANLSMDYDSDRCIYAHSRYTVSYDDNETNRIVFLDQAAYEKYGSKIGNVSGSVLGDIRAADYICYLGWSADDETDVITCGATEVEDNVSDALDLPAETVTLMLIEGPYIYTGNALEPASAVYSDNWSQDEAVLTYADNGAEGTATVTMTVNALSVSKTFEIQTYKAQVGETQYTSLQEAIDNAGDGYVMLIADCGDATVSSNLYLDLNGYNLTNVTVSADYTLSLFDSTTDDYEGAYGTASVTGNVSSFVEYGGKTYLVVADDSGVYSAHCYAVELTHVSLKPSDDALGYKAQLHGDEIVLAHVKSFGFNLSVAGGASRSYTKNVEGEFDGVFTLRLKGIMAANGGEMDITGSAFVIFDIEDKTVTTDEHTTTMKQTIETVNENFASYSADKQTAVKDLVTKYASKMTGWNIGNITAWTPTEE